MLQGHGDDIQNAMLRMNFSSNVYPSLQPSGLKPYLQMRLDSIDHYPPAEPVEEQRLWAEHLHVPFNSILLTNGATEAIYLVATWLEQQRTHACRSAILVPTFSEYEDACRMAGHELLFCQSLDEVPDDVNALWLCNPNNPTGSVIPLSVLTTWAVQHPHALLVVDQSYDDFCSMPMLSPQDAALSNNIIQLHSMTKRFAVPGLRLGYVISSHQIISGLRSLKMPWSVNTLALDACRWLLFHQQPFCMKEYLDETQRFLTNIQSIDGYKAMPTNTHFFLVKCHKWNSLELKQILLQKYGILIRSCHNFRGLDASYIRLATQSRSENEFLVDCLKQMSMKR
jgi:threonine-phosphate decarboxylase